MKTEKLVTIMCVVVLLCCFNAAHGAPDISTWQTEAAGISGNVVNDSGDGNGEEGGEGYVFDGTASISYDFGQLNDSTTAHDDGSTIEVIFNLADPGDYDRLVSQVGWNTDTITLNHETWSNGGLGMTYVGSVDIAHPSDTTVNDTDVHVVWVENGDGTVNLFVNGIDLGDDGYSNWWLNGGNGYLGGGAGSAYVTGTVYGVATYDHALSDTQIASLAAAAGLTESIVAQIDANVVKHTIDMGDFNGTNQYTWFYDDSKFETLKNVRAAGVTNMRVSVVTYEIFSLDVCPDLATFNANKNDPAWIDSLNWDNDVEGNQLMEAKQDGFNTMAIFAYGAPCFMERTRGQYPG